jgi:hypothetical protein
MSTPDCGPHCRPVSKRDPYGYCCSCVSCHGKRHAPPRWMSWLARTL